MVNKFIYLLASLALFILTACGGDDATKGQLTASNATMLSLSVSDAPVDDLSQVVVCFFQIELKSEMGDSVFEVGGSENMIAPNELCLDENEEVIGNTVGLDLLLVTGDNVFTLLENILIESGDYSQVRLMMADGSYGVFAYDDVTKVTIKVPSNELKLDGFIAPIGGELDLTAEFDLRKSMTNPVGQDHYILKPRGVRLVDNSESATIAGSVDMVSLCDFDYPEMVGSIYLYQGFGYTLAELADNNGSDQDAYASTVVNYDGENYSYEIGFVTSGDYTIAMSCESEDLPETDDGFVFVQQQQITVTTQNLVVDFDAPPTIEE